MSRKIRCGAIKINNVSNNFTRKKIQLQSAVFSASYDLADTYDAYEKDIAVVSFYFEQSTVFEFARYVNNTT